MKIPPFKLERYFAEYEFKVRYLLSPSDCEGLSMEELLGMADPDGLELWKRLKLGYTESDGHPLLRQEISQLYTSIAPQEVIVAAPEEAIFIAMNVLLQQGDHAVVISPAYQSLYEIAGALGCEVTLWPVELDGENWSLDVGKLVSALRPETRLVVVNFPHNPTGLLPAKETFKAIVDLVRSRGIILFSDEMYRYLERDPQDQLPSACDLYENAIVLSGLSKAFALPGLRIGWLAAHDLGLFERFQAFKDYTTICSSAPSEILGIIALRARAPILRRNQEIVRRNQGFAESFFARHPNSLKWIRPDAGSTAFPRWLGSLPVEQFCAQMLETHGVMIVPGSIFDVPGSHFRVGLGRRNFSEVLEQVGEYLDRYPE